jgi:hypothetical protein
VAGVKIELGMVAMEVVSSQLSVLRCQDFAGELFCGDVHLLLGLVVDGDGSVFVEGKGSGGFSAVLEVTRREAEPAVVHAEGDFVGTHLDYGVVGAVESVGGCVAAKQGGPGGPEFGVEAIVQ